MNRLLISGLVLAAAASTMAGSAAAQSSPANCQSGADCSLSADQEAAANVVRAYYSALAARNYPAAYAHWNNGGAASGKSLADFTQGFAQTSSTSATITNVGELDGAAGSIFIPISVDIQSTLSNGTRQHFSGTYTLRRVNDVPGSTAEQREWHIQSANIVAVK